MDEDFPGNISVVPCVEFWYNNRKEPVRAAVKSRDHSKNEVPSDVYCYRYWDAVTVTGAEGEHTVLKWDNPSPRTVLRSRVWRIVSQIELPLLIKDRWMRDLLQHHYGLHKRIVLLTEEAFFPIDDQDIIAD